MKLPHFVFVVILLTVFSISVHAQEIDSLVYLGINTIAFNQQFDGLPIEELSGIEYSGTGNTYLVIPQSRKKAHVFVCAIDITSDGLKVSFDSIIYLQRDALEGESIRINPGTKKKYIAEENDKNSLILEVGKRNTLRTIYKSNEPLRHNKGYEGLCFSKDGTWMYIGLERPLNGNTTKIIAYNLQTKEEITYSYQLDVLENDTELDNGITELLTLNDSTLLVVERAFIRSEKKDSVRVYKVYLPKEGNQAIKSKLLTDFSGVPKLDNVEGVAFSASGKELIFITDNNGNKYQQTQFICMKIE